VPAPLAVALGETLPHCDALHETVQVTPLPEESLVTVAVKGAPPPAETEVEPAETETMIREPPPVGELLPPQPAMISIATPRYVTGKNLVDFIFSSAGSMSAPAKLWLVHGIETALGSPIAGPSGAYFFFNFKQLNESE
jgi:hypothetical protein